MNDAKYRRDRRALSQSLMNSGDGRVLRHDPTEAKWMQRLGHELDGALFQGKLCKADSGVVDQKE